MDIGGGVRGGCTGVRERGGRRLGRDVRRIWLGIVVSDASDVGVVWVWDVRRQLNYEFQPLVAGVP